MVSYILKYQDVWVSEAKASSETEKCLLFNVEHVGIPSCHVKKHLCSTPLLPWIGGEEDDESTEDEQVIVKGLQMLGRGTYEGWCFRYWANAGSISRSRVY